MQRGSAGRTDLSIRNGAEHQNSHNREKDNTNSRENGLGKASLPSSSSVDC